MLTLLCVLVATTPYAVVFGLLAWKKRRERRGREVLARQIALTDAVYERLGAVAAPVVRRRRGGWRVGIAVPFDRPAVTDGLLAIVREAFARHRRSLEVVLTRQDDPPSTKADGGCGVGWEGLSWRSV